MLRERRAGSFHRALRLSDRLDAAAATSSFTDGVLTVTVPKLEASKPKRIEVTGRVTNSPTAAARACAGRRRRASRVDRTGFRPRIEYGAGSPPE